MTYAKLPSAHQRLSQRINELEVTAKKSLGQNFLVSDHVIEKIIAAAESFNAKSVVEIGPGCGALTDLLLQRFQDLKLIELDRVLFEYWKSKGCNIINADALQIDWSAYEGCLLVSNLPYQISSSLVIERSLDKKPLMGMVLMFQKEVAQRLRATEEDSEYGMLSIMAQEFWDIQIVCDASPNDFKPPPKVSSRVLMFKPRQSQIENPQNYLSFLKSAFRQRRRILKSNLKGLDPSFDVNQLIPWLNENKKTETVRAEELSVQEMNSLYHRLKK